mmetsp:Transcript_27401/g.63983  ORF Transcript_27401/g.63983 Transcript_27401/m.63983 type:complete len:114 (-) Transcript_27401:2472-2813(-)
MQDLLNIAQLACNIINAAVGESIIVSNPLECVRGQESGEPSGGDDLDRVAIILEDSSTFSSTLRKVLLIRNCHLGTAPPFIFTSVLPATGDVEGMSAANGKLCLVSASIAMSV